MLHGYSDPANELVANSSLNNYVFNIEHVQFSHCERCAIEGPHCHVFIPSNKNEMGKRKREKRYGKIDKLMKVYVILN